MTQFATVSAWAALGFGAMFAVNAYFQFATGVSGWLFAATALALAVGGFRTLRKMSGGLRLLAGAWGLAAGLLSLDLRATQIAPPDAVLHDTYYVASSAGWLGITLFGVAMLGLALTVLHKETN